MTRGRKVILPAVLAELEKHEGSAVTATRIAHALRLDVDAVRKALQNYWWAHRDGPVARMGTGIFMWVGQAGTSKPTSGAPVASTPLEQAVVAKEGWIAPPPSAVVPELAVRRGGIQYGDVVPRERLTFTKLKLMEDDRLLLEDDEGVVWLAYRV